MSDVKVYEVNQGAHCSMYGCHDNVKLAVGNPRFDMDSIFLCEKHAKKIYEELRGVFNANMVGDDDPMKQNELYQHILVDVLEVHGKKLNRETLQGICDQLNIVYTEEDVKDSLVDKCLKFLKGGSTDGEN